MNVSQEHENKCKFQKIENERKMKMNKNMGTAMVDMVTGHHWDMDILCFFSLYFVSLRFFRFILLRFASFPFSFTS